MSILLFAIALLPFDWEEYAENQESTTGAWLVQFGREVVVRLGRERLVHCKPRNDRKPCRIRIMICYCVEKLTTISARSASDNIFDGLKRAYKASGRMKKASRDDPPLIDLA